MPHSIRNGRLLIASLAPAAVVAAGVAAYLDYVRWKALGEGGIPWGLAGWIEVTRMRVRLSAVDPTDATHFPEITPHPALESLPVRDYRPTIAPHPVPHRQSDQRSTPLMLSQLSDTFDTVLSDHRDQVEERLSLAEKHNPALFSDALAASGHSPTGELAHFHRLDGSMHMHLNPADARLIVERGWGEFHRLSGRQHLVPASYTLIYAPRNDTELSAVRTILEVTTEWATAVRQP